MGLIVFLVGAVVFGVLIWYKTKPEREARYKQARKHMEDTRRLHDQLELRLHQLIKLRDEARLNPRPIPAIYDVETGS